MKEFKERGFNDELDLDTLFVVFLNKINSLLLIFGLATLVLLLSTLSKKEFINPKRCYNLNKILLRFCHHL